MRGAPHTPLVPSLDVNWDLLYNPVSRVFTVLRYATLIYLTELGYKKKLTDYFA